MKAFDASESLSFEERKEALMEHSSFPAFFKTVEKKGFFEGVEEGTVDYLRRYEHMMERFEGRIGGVPTGGRVKREEEEGEEGGKGEEEQAREEKKKGDDSIRGGDFDRAVGHYTNALDLVLDREGTLGHFISILLANRAAANTHLKKFEEAVEDCERACELNPSYVKAWTRKGKNRVLYPPK